MSTDDKAEFKEICLPFPGGLRGLGVTGMKMGILVSYTGPRPPDLPSEPTQQDFDKCLCFISSNTGTLE